MDPITKLRHGKGTYAYPNKFFQYDGEWQNGVKQGLFQICKKIGNGALYMKDGTKYEGDFNNGEITVLFISVLSS